MFAVYDFKVVKIEGWAEFLAFLKDDPALED